MRSFNLDIDYYNNFSFCHLRKPKLKDYQLDQFIGEGSTGSVWIGSYKGKGPLAIKSLRKSSINLKLISEGLVKVYERNGHPGIAKIYDFNLSSENPYITYKLYAETTELNNSSKIIKKRTLEELCAKVEYKDVVRIALKLAKAINFLHQNDIAHCNIKPTNILFEDGVNPEPKLSDFSQGHLSGVEDLALSDSLFFCPPEQLNGGTHFKINESKVWDIYNFGSTIYKLLTGEFCRLNKEILNFKKRNQNTDFIHSGITPNQVARAIRKRPNIKWPTESESKDEEKFREIIEKCLSLDIADRFASIDDVINEIQNCSYKPPHLNIISPSKSNPKRTANKRVKPSKVKLTTTIAVSVALGYICGSHINNQSKDQNKNSNQFVASSSLTSPPPEKEVAEITEPSEEAILNTLDEAKLDYLFNDLQESQAALNEICQMIVKRDSEGNSLYKFPEGTIGTILSYYEKFIERKEDEPALRDSVITALNNSSELNLLLGDYDSAAKKLTSAAAYLENDEIGGGESNEIIQKKAKIYNNLSTSLIGSRKFMAAALASKKSYDLIHTIHNQDKENNDSARKVASSAFALSQNYLKTNNLELSELYAEKTIELLNEITEDQLLLETDEYHYAITNLQLGTILSLKENYSSAREYLQLSIEQFTGLITAFPENINYQFQLTRALGKEADNAFVLSDSNAVLINNDSIELLRNLINNEEREVFKYELGCRLHTFSKSLLSEGEYSAARTQANSALTILKEIRKTEPSNIDYQHKTSEIYRMLIDLHKEAGDHKKAIEYSREALTLAEVLLEKDRDVEKNNKRKTNNQLKLARDHGVLGYNLINLKDDDESTLKEASECFKEAQKHYKEILFSEPKNKKAQEGIQWTLDILSQIPKNSS